MKKIILSLSAVLMLSACSLVTEAAMSVKNGVSTTGSALTSTTDNATKATKSSSGSEDKNWEYDEGKTV